MSSTAHPGVFVSFEGGDGAGKSTQSRLLGEWVEREFGREVVRTREPGGTAMGLQLRQLVLHGEDVDPRTEALLYATDRAHHVASLVRPALERGAVVITDRYLDSSLAYQAGGRELGMEELRDLQMWAVGGLLPDVTILLDLDPALLPQRLTGAPDRLERSGEEFHRRTRDAYLGLAVAEPQRWTVLEANRPIDHLAVQVRERVAPLLGSA
ncbi:dTMP kinase [Serinibacter salmoneus]|uniref:Thymidylate kinase n=1 Tax=Serinibacter salmoneus TaxID=556530 RepID=A0A2A9D471_9MICO|nr:dTMP kinase [Serinibacter salmoneus]PFG20649.1 thymidylate kinase [Serinibacter salmoneus]